MNVTIGEVIALMGVPSAITGVIVWFFKRKIEQRRKRVDERENALTEILVAMVSSINATIALCEAMAKAIARIPDAHCNGDMHDALEYVQTVKRAQKGLLEKIGIKSTISEQ